MRDATEEADQAAAAVSEDEGHAAIRIGEVDEDRTAATCGGPARHLQRLAAALEVLHAGALAGLGGMWCSEEKGGKKGKAGVQRQGSGGGSQSNSGWSVSGPYCSSPMLGRWIVACGSDDAVQ